MSEVQQQENVQPLEGSETSENNVINESDYQEDLSSDDANSSLCMIKHRLKLRNYNQ